MGGAFRGRWARGCLVGLVLACSGGAFAQTSTAPGRIEQDTRPEPRPAPRDTIRLDTARYAEQAPAGAAAVGFTLGAVQLEGNRAIATEALAPLWAARLGQRISLADAFAIAGAISARYRETGYVLSQAIVPAQDLPTGAPATLQIQVLEGYVEQVLVGSELSAALQPHLAPVLAERPLRLATLERALLLVNELAGVSAQASVRAGTSAGASVLELAVARDRAGGSLAVHNRSTKAQGRVRFEAGGEVRGVLGAFDRHGLRLISSGDDRLNLLAYAGEAPVGAGGLKLQWNASASRSEPDSPLPNVDTESNNLSLGLSYPVLRSRASNVALRAAIGGYDNQSGGGLTSRDRIRSARIGLAADHADAAGGISLVDLEFVKGLGGLGASERGDPLLNGADPEFARTSLYLARLQSLGGNFSLLLAATAQASGDRLPTAEQLGLGGDTFVRAFDPSEAIGENGAAGKLELRWSFGLGPGAGTLYAYYDAGRVSRKQTSGPDLRTTLAATGLGLRFSGPAGLRGYLEYAKPLKRDVASEGNRKGRVFAGLGIDL